VPSSSQLISAYLAHLEAEGYSAGTRVSTRRWLEGLAAHAGGLAELGSAELTAFEQRLRWQPNALGKLYSENSVNQAIDAIRRFYRWAAAVSHVVKDPTLHMMTRRVRPKPKRELSTADARKLLAQPNPKTFHGARDRAILGLLIEHRLAFQALANLDTGHFHYDTGALLVGGRHRRILSLSDGLADDLQHYLTGARPGVAKVGEPALFVSRAGVRMTGNSYRTVLDRHAQSAGLSKTRFSS
jgi:integrase/recombinase XerD